MKVRCIEQIQKRGITFRTGETYTASEINKNWYVVDSIGVESEEFKLHFEEIITEEEAEARVIYYMENKVEQEVLPDLFDEEKTNEEYKETWWDRLMNYIFV